MSASVRKRSCDNFDGSVAACLSAAKRKKVAANSHPLAKPLPEGLVLTDLFKGEWKVGKPVGSGGFGLIYLGEFTVMC